LWKARARSPAGFAGRPPCAALEIARQLQTEIGELGQDSTVPLSHVRALIHEQKENIKEADCQDFSA
jgi:hypothetical protein